MNSCRFHCGSWGAIAFLPPGVVFGQSEEPFHHLTLSAGAGLTTVTGTNTGKLDHGGNLQLNGGYFFNRYFGITGNFMFSYLGITRAELDNLNMSDGGARVYAVTADPTLRFPLGRGFSAYVLVGGDLRQTVEFTADLAENFPARSTVELFRPGTRAG